MKRTWKLWALPVLILAALLAFTASALADMPSNPYRPESEMMNRLFNRRAWLYGISFDELQSPSMEQIGAWSVTVDQDLITEHGAATRMLVYFMSVDATGSYTTFYRSGDNSVVDTVVSPTFVAPGSYRLAVYVYLADGESYAGYQDIVIAEDGVHPTVAQKVQQIVSQCRVQGDDWQTALNMHDWLTSHAYYDLTYSYYGAEDVLFRGFGVCDSYSKAYQFLLNAAGIPNERVFSETHAWNIAQFDGKWYHIDVTWDDPSGSSAAVSGNETHTYFCVNDDLLYGMLDDRSVHVTEPSCVGTCVSLDAWHPIHTGEWRNYGVYFSAPEILNYADLMAEQVQAGDASFTVTADAFYPTSVTQTGGGGYSYFGYNATNATAKRNRYIFALGLSAKGLPLNATDTLRVNASFNTSTLVFSVTVLGWMNAGTGSLDLPADLTEIGDSAFEGTDAASVTVPFGCLSIGDYAFANSSVQYVEIPNPATQIGEGAFDGCSPLMIIAPDGSEAADYAEENGILRLRP